MLSFIKQGGKTLEIPYSGRIMHFPDTRYFENAWQSRKSHGGFKPIWGGALTGYLIQGLQADVFAYKDIELYKEFGKASTIPFHDEQVIESEDREEEYNKFKHVFRKTPPFIPKEHFPYLEAEFWKGKRYNKQ